MRSTIIFLLLASSILLQAQSMTWSELKQLGIQAYNKGNYTEAIEWFEKVVEQAKLEFNKEHPDYATSLNNLTS